MLDGIRLCADYRWRKDKPGSQIFIVRQSSLDNVTTVATELAIL
jgi:hypothetical protein